MSRVGSSVIMVPAEVSIFLDSSFIEAKGPKGTLKIPIFADMTLIQEDCSLILKTKAKPNKALCQKWGLQNSLIKNMIQGVMHGYSKQLDIIGVGYRAEVIGNNLVLKLGFSHDVIFPIPDGISVKMLKPTQVLISGIDKQKVGQVASDICMFRKPEPYKGKGIHYSGKKIILKQVKKK